EGSLTMWFELIACDIFVREVSYYVATSPHAIDMTFLEKGLHEKPDYLRQGLQQKIDQTSSLEKKYDATLLAYALCGNATQGLIARDIPVVIPKAHDCITLFLGSRERYMVEFNEKPGTYYYTPSAIERGYTVGAETSLSKEKKYAEYLEKYGEDNAKYLMEMEDGFTKNYSYAAFIDLEPFRFLNCPERVKEIARNKSLEYRELPGNLCLLQELVYGDWNENKFLVLQPGQKMEASNDERVIHAVE
ncbi:MAG: DUF1638 domain-containing protein, partial [Candidatus Atribacteria bacterium]|nr:DUF1638 domain-containing protein [Candidatus Atribacteria bacterium]